MKRPGILLYQEFGIIKTCRNGLTAPTGAGYSWLIECCKKRSFRNSPISKAKVGKKWGGQKERNEREDHGKGQEGPECTSQLPSLFLQKKTCERVGIVIILEPARSLPSTR